MGRPRSCMFPVTPAGVAGLLRISEPLRIPGASAEPEQQRKPECLYCGSTVRTDTCTPPQCQRHRKARAPCRQLLMAAPMHVRSATYRALVDLGPRIAPRTSPMPIPAGTVSGNRGDSPATPSFVGLFQFSSCPFSASALVGISSVLSESIRFSHQLATHY